MNSPNIVGNIYDKYATRNPVAMLLMRGFLNAVFELCHDTSPETLLEVGCGEGHLTFQLWKNLRPITKRVDACDLSLDQVPDPYRQIIHFQRASVYKLPYNDASFDLVVCCEVLEHLNDPEKGLEELTRVSKGRVLLSTPWEPMWRTLNMLRGKYLRNWGNTPGHIQHFTRNGLRTLVATRLDIITMRTPLPWTILLGKPRRIP